MILSFLYIASLVILAAYSLINFSEFMDQYETGILILSIPSFIWFGFFWPSFKKLFLNVFNLSIGANFFFQPGPRAQTEKFFTNR